MQLTQFFITIINMKHIHEYIHFYQMVTVTSSIISF